jgi:tetratricopeptide (TPR) repeat protein
VRILERYAQDYERDHPGLVQDAMSLQFVLPTPSRYTNYAWHVAILLDDTGHPMEALALCAYLVEHYRQSGDQENLADALYNQAMIIHAHGDLDGAMALYQEQERLCRELGLQDGLARSLAGQALLLSQMGRSHEALPLAEEAYLLATTRGFAALARQIKPILDAVRSSGERT